MTTVVRTPSGPRTPPSWASLLHLDRDPEAEDDQGDQLQRRIEVRFCTPASSRGARPLQKSIQMMTSQRLPRGLGAAGRRPTRSTACDW